VGADSPSSGSQILGSAIRAIIPSDGTYYLRVTGAGSQEGRYGLLVGAFPAVPEPSSTLLLAMGSLGLIGLRRRKRGHATA
jgi:hypothetical protein